MTLLCDDSGLKFGAWRKPDSYLGGAKPESCKTGSFFFAAMALSSSSPLCPIYTDLSLKVEKMKSEMLNLQIQLHSTDAISAATRGETTPPSESLRRRRNFSAPNLEERKPDKLEMNVNSDSFFTDFPESPNSTREESPLAAELMKHPIETSLCEISEVEEDAGDNALNLDKNNKRKGQSKDNPLVSAVQLFGDGVSQVQSIGNQAVNNIVSFLNIPPDDSDSNETSTAGDGISYEREGENTLYTHLDRSTSLQSDRSRTSEAASLQIGRIFYHIWFQMRSNNDVVCYCGFLLVFLWNFSLLSMVYLAALFLYALCVNTGPSYIFWVIMLIYTEIYILIQYIYQIIIQHCGFSIQSTTLK